MDWFFAINERSAAFDIYTQLAKVAVYTALTHTLLRPRMLYDGRENAFTSWMQSRGVDLIFAESYSKGLIEAESLSESGESNTASRCLRRSQPKKTRVAIEHLRHRNPGLQSSKPSRLQRLSTIE
jgi:hypothetical protein